MKILHIEDEIEIAQAVKKMLLPEVQIVHTVSPEEGIELALTGNFDLILCDVSLGSYLTGFDVVKELKNQGLSTPVISNSSNHSANEMMTRLGAVCYLSKIKSQADISEETKERWIKTFQSFL
jgi:CheY-like chemotaxis protein